MRPYKENFDIGHFGTDNPATDVVERMPFVVEYRKGVDVTPAGLPGADQLLREWFAEIGQGKGGGNERMARGTSSPSRPRRPSSRRAT